MELLAFMLTRLSYFFHKSRPKVIQELLVLFFLFPHILNIRLVISNIVRLNCSFYHTNHFAEVIQVNLIPKIFLVLAAMLMSHEKAVEYESFTVSMRAKLSAILFTVFYSFREDLLQLLRDPRLGSHYVHSVVRLIGVNVVAFLGFNNRSTGQVTFFTSVS